MKVAVETIITPSPRPDARSHAEAYCALMEAYEIGGSSNHHLLNAANNHLDNLHRIAPSVVAIAIGDEVHIGRTHLALPDGRVGIQPTVTARVNPNFGRVNAPEAFDGRRAVAAGLLNHSPQAQELLREQAFFHEGLRQTATTEKQPIDSFVGAIKAFLGFRQTVTTYDPSAAADFAAKRLESHNQAAIDQTIMVHLPANRGRPSADIASEILFAETTHNAQLQEILADTAAAAERQASFEAATFNEARSAATTTVEHDDGEITITLDVAAFEGYQAALMYGKGY